MPFAGLVASQPIPAQIRPQNTTGTPSAELLQNLAIMKKKEIADKFKNCGGSGKEDSSDSDEDAFNTSEAKVAKMSTIDPSQEPQTSLGKRDREESFEKPAEIWAKISEEEEKKVVVEEDLNKIEAEQ